MKVSVIVCALGWASAFVLMWAWLLEAVRVDALSGLGFLFFVVMGLGAGVSSRMESKKPPR